MTNQVTPVDFAVQNFSKTVEELKALTRIPSLSSVNDEAEMKRSADAVAGLMSDAGLENVELLYYKDAPPYVYGDWLHAPGKPTLLLYAHHDVQPVGRSELWKTEPFEPTEIDGRLFGRGAADDKAGVVVHTAAVGAYLKTLGQLPVNIKMIVEGEEEVGSGHLAGFLQEFQTKLKADVAILTDTANFDVGVPSITTSLRGNVIVEVELRVMKQSLHSGLWGGPIPDPAMGLSKLLAGLVDDKGAIAVPGILDEVVRPTKTELAHFEELNYTEAQFREQVGMGKDVTLLGDPEISLPEKLWRAPSLTICAIQSSSRKNAGNTINDSAWARIGLRLVPKMDGAKVERLLLDYLKENKPWGLEMHIEKESPSDWWCTEPEGAAFENAQRALSKAFDRPCVFIGCGGTIPFVEPFAQSMGGIPALLIGVEDPYTNAHSENESVHLGDLEKAIKGAVYLYEELKTLQ